MCEKEDAGTLCELNGRVSDVEFDRKCRRVQVSNFVIVGVRVAVANEMNSRITKSTTLGTNNSIRKGMVWLRIYVDIPHIAATAMLVAGVVTTVVPLHTDVFEDSHGGRVTTAPLHPPRYRHVPFRYPLSAYLVSSSTC